MYGARLGAAGYGEITTEIAAAGPFYYAEEYHQQYLAKNPNGYCGLGGTGVSCPVGSLVLHRKAPAISRRLVLWDIDGTLVDSVRLGRLAFEDAFEHVTGGRR